MNISSYIKSFLHHSFPMVSNIQLELFFDEISSNQQTKRSIISLFFKIIFFSFLMKKSTRLVFSKIMLKIIKLEKEK